jgi:ubiquinone/menaquinone biosynthesis C-methylase UbiE
MSYIDTNKTLWNNKVSIHLDSEFYDMPSFMSGKSSLNSIELDILGDIKGLSVLHLQCHFGQDTISLSRLGAKAVGVDFSEKAIETAHQIAKDTQSNAQFICSDVYELPNVLDEKFDIVFTSYGTIGWLPDLDRWASVVSHFLKPGGRFIMAEFHPVLWMFDDDVKQVEHSYFNAAPIIGTEKGTYADKAVEQEFTYHCWNHSNSEVINSLISKGLTIKLFNEYDYSPYNIFSDGVEIEKGKYIVKHMGNKIPLVFAIEAELKL